MGQVDLKGVEPKLHQTAQGWAIRGKDRDGRLKWYSFTTRWTVDKFTPACVVTHRHVADKRMGSWRCRLSDMQVVPVYLSVPLK